MTRCALWDELLLASLVGREVLRDEESPVWQHEPFIAWVADQARTYTGRRRATCLTDDEFLGRGHDLRARVLARSLAVRRSAHPPVIRDDADPGNAACVVDEPMSRTVPVISLGVAAGVGRELWDEIPDQWITLPPDVPNDRYVALRIIGESMTPLMHTGDIVLVHVGPDVKVDTVIVARHPDDGYVCKRVSCVGKRGIELASLEAGRPLIVIPYDPTLVVGTVHLVWRSHHTRTVQPGSA
jgi:SOS-response transcriptional repressor LexA